MIFPWEAQSARSTEETVTALQRDLAYMVTHTAVLAHSKHPALAMLVNTGRGQLFPKGECKFTDGSAVEFQDVGMPQPGAPEMTLQVLMSHIWGVAHELGLELET